MGERWLKGSSERPGQVGEEPIRKSPKKSATGGCLGRVWGDCGLGWGVS